MVVIFDRAPMLRQGDHGEDVLTLQELLIAADYSLVADGVFGPRTGSALASFQTDHGLETTKTTTAVTWEQLVVTVREGDRGAAVRAVQRRLGVSADGIFGPGTRGAVERFQSQRGLDTDGIVGQKTWQAMLDIGRVVDDDPVPEPEPESPSVSPVDPSPSHPSGPVTLDLVESVGRGGANRPDDVVAVKRRLVELGYDWLTVDANVNAETVAAISLFQSIIAGRHTIGGDGRVDLDRTTHRWLRAANAPRWTEQPVGSRTGPDGFYNVEVAEQSGDHHDYGTDWLAQTVRDAGRAYQDQYRTRRSTAAPITVNDAAPPRGGDTPDHAGHETGLSVDLRLPRTDGNAGGITFRDSEYDRDAMREMLRAFRAQPKVVRTLFNDPELSEMGLCVHHDGHDDHAHVEVVPPMLDEHSRTVRSTFERAIDQFDGVIVDPVAYPMTVDGFARYLDDTGVEHFTAEEMTTPNHTDVAMRLGYEQFLPPHDWWVRGAALALLADRLRDAVNEPVTMRNWFRPRPYNDHPVVGGRPESDHILAAGVDLDYRSNAAYTTALEELRRIQRTEPWLHLSLGEYGGSTHVGIASPRGRRTWTTADTDSGTTIRTPTDGRVAPSPTETGDPSLSDAPSDRRYRVIDSEAWLRDSEANFAPLRGEVPALAGDPAVSADGRDGTWEIRFGVHVTIDETVDRPDGEVALVRAADDGRELGWTMTSNLHWFLIDNTPADVPLAPSEPVPTDGLVGKAHSAAQVYNRIGGLASYLAAVFGIDTRIVTAIYTAEGGALADRDRPLLRFENHVFYDIWGKDHSETFDAHFQCLNRSGSACARGTRGRSGGHQYRPTSADAWTTLHPRGVGGETFQTRQYEARTIASELSNTETATLACSVGGPQVLGRSHAILGYDSATAMFEAFDGNERAQLLGFFEFMRRKQVDGRTALAWAREGNWNRVASAYNGGDGYGYDERIAAIFDAVEGVF